METIKKAWGKEVILISNELYSAKLMILKGGYQCSIHYHREKDETFMLLVGTVTLEMGNSYQQMEPFLEYRIPSGLDHRFAGHVPYSVLLEVSTEDKAEDSYRKTESGRIYV